MESAQLEEAFKEIVEGGNLFGQGNVKGLKAVKKSAEGLSFLAGRADWGAHIFIERFLSLFPGASLVHDADALMATRATAASEAVFGPETGPIGADYGTARFVLSFGDAPLDSGVPLVSIARQIADARINRRLQWAVVDPRLSTSASKSDLWVPIIPGTDGNLALGIMKALLEEYPASLKVQKERVAGLVKGMNTADLAESCGLSHDMPLRLARMLAENRSGSAVIPGGGILSQPNAREVAALILSLNKMVGSVPGSGGLVQRDDRFLHKAKEEILGDSSVGRDQRELGRPCDVLMIWRADPVYDDPHGMSAYLKDRSTVALSVAISTHITESASLADYILPDTTYLERWDICESPRSVTTPGIGLRSPTVGGFDSKTGRYFPIVAQSRTMEDILINLESDLGLLSRGGHKTAWGFYRDATRKVLDGMRQAGFSISGSDRDVSRAFARGGIFLEPSRSLTSPPARKSTPEFGAVQPKALPKEAAAQGDTFLLISYTLPFHRSPGSGLNKWLLEVLPENRLAMNPDDAHKKGIGRGETVVVKAADGTSLKCIAQILPGIRPGVVALARGFGYRGSGAETQVVSDTPTPSEPALGAGVNVAALASGKGMNPVQVEKA